MEGNNYFDSNSRIYKILLVSCSLFLIFLGIKSIFAKFNSNFNEHLYNKKNIDDKKNLSYIFSGLAVEVLNPIALTFFLCILVDLTKDTVNYVKFFIWLEIIFLGLCYFLFISMLASRITHYLKRFSKIFLIISGFAFIYYGIELLVKNL